MHLKEKLRNYCSNLGFDLVGFVDPLSIKEQFPVLSEMKSRGYYSCYANQDISLRVDVERLLPGVRSILVLGLGYYHNQNNYAESPLKARPARYARTRDYHQVFRKKMANIVSYLEKETGCFAYKMLVDSSPLPERFLAEKTGKGWIGQNTCFYTKDTGSWIFLGEILLTIPFEADVKIPNVNSCLECMRCVRACPTGALKGGYTLDANKCLAYLTQSKKIIHDKYRGLIKDVIIGCDICQDVCPYNQNIRVKEQKIFAPLTYLEEFDLLELLELSRSQFKERYGMSAFAWRGRNVLIRNAIMALGNQKALEAIPLLTRYLDHPDTQLRLYAAWALQKLGKQEFPEV